MYQYLDELFLITQGFIYLYKFISLAWTLMFRNSCSHFSGFAHLISFINSHPKSFLLPFRRRNILQTPNTHWFSFLTVVCALHNNVRYRIKEDEELKQESGKTRWSILGSDCRTPNTSYTDSKPDSWNEPRFWELALWLMSPLLRPMELCLQTWQVVFIKIIILLTAILGPGAITIINTLTYCLSSSLAVHTRPCDRFGGSHRYKEHQHSWQETQTRNS